MTDGRKNNMPPGRGPYLDDEAVAVVDQMWAMGVTQVAIGRHFEIHPRTIMAAINRRAAYARIPTSESHAQVLAQRSQPAIRFLSKAKRNAGVKGDKT